MTVSYDMFTEAFLAKVTEYNFCHIEEHNRQALVDGYMKRACAKFSEVCVFDIANGDDDIREFDLVDATDADVEEIVDIVSEGMVFQWIKQYYYAQRNLEVLLNTADFTSYSPAELLYRITNAYKTLKSTWENMIKEYSYRHGDLTVLHL